MTDLPEPMSAPDCDLRGYEFMPLFGQRMFGSTFYSLALQNPRAGLAGQKLWWEAWQQRPAGSLPKDDFTLARLADFGTDLKTWERCKAVALHGFQECSDGRLYHPLLCAEAKDAYARRLRDRQRKADQRARRVTRNEGGTSASPPQDVHDQSDGCPTGQDADAPRMSFLTGQDRTGQDLEERTPNPNADASGDLEPSVFEQTTGVGSRPAGWTGQWRGTRRSGTNPRAEAARRPRTPAPEPDHPLWPKLRGVLAPSDFAVWIAKLTPMEADDGAMVFIAPSRFHADFVRGNFGEALHRALGPVRIEVGQ